MADNLVVHDSFFRLLTIAFGMISPATGSSFLVIKGYN